MSGERMAALRATLDSSSQLDRVKQQLERLRSTDAVVSGWLDTLGKLHAERQVYRARSVGDQTPVATEKLRRCIDELRAKLQPPFDVTDGKTFVQLRTDVEKLVATMDEELTRSWRRWLKELRPHFNKAEVAKLESQDEYRAAATMLLADDKKLADSEKSRGRTEQDFVDVENLASRMRERLAPLQSQLDAPEEVKRFLEAAGTIKGAPLEQFTPQIVDWLKAQNLLGKYGVKRVAK